jgi:hypothetical protein
LSAWIKLHANAFAHPKTLRMAKRLGVSPAAVVGHLASLWTWALEYAPQGDLASFEVEELEIAAVEIAAGWDGDDGALVHAAVGAGYLDATEAGLLHVHDWNDYAGNLLARRERNRDYMRKARGHHVGTTARPRGGLEKSREELNHSSPADADEGHFANADVVRIPLTNGRNAIIDADDLHLVEPHGWYAIKSGHGEYAATKVKTRVLLMHRLIAGLPDDHDGRDVHHENGDGLDNRRQNLTVLTRAEHMAAHRTVRMESSPDDRFAEFWTLYPRKVGKAETEKRWAKMSVTSRVTAIAAAGHLATYARAQGAELRFIPHPATFIGPKRTYEDWANGMPAGYGAQSAAPKRDACPDCGTDLTFDEELRPHCPYCGWRPT